MTKLEKSLAYVQALRQEPKEKHWLSCEQVEPLLGLKEGRLKKSAARRHGPHHHVDDELTVHYHVSDIDAYLRREIRRAAR